MIRTPGSARASANMLAMVFLDSQSTNYDSRNDLRFAHHIQNPVQKQGRPVSNQRSGQGERLRNTRSCRLKTPRYRGKAKRLSTKGSLASRSINSTNAKYRQRKRPPISTIFYL